MPDVALYVGKGAVMAVDVSKTLTELNILHDFLDEGDVQKGLLKGYHVLIVPGGYTREILQSLGVDGRRGIVDFVRRGGGYIGICAGAYIAHKLGFTRAVLKREKGVFLCYIFIKSDHPITRGFRGKVTIFYQNGPKIIPSSDDTVLAEYSDGGAAIILTTYHKGSVVLFSPHPEKLPGTQRLLENAICYCLS